MRMFFRVISLIGLLALTILVSLALAGPVSAQGGGEDADTCPVLVEEALTLAEDSCMVLGRNEACYGYTRVEAVGPNNEPLPHFDTQGDVAGIDELNALATAPMDLDAGEWGVAILRIQADLPDSLPGQNVTFVLFGDVSLEADTGADTALQAFYLQNGLGDPLCEEAPRDGVLVQAPEDTTVHFMLNGVEVEVGSTGLLWVGVDGALNAGTFEGSIRLVSAAVDRLIEPGFTAKVLPDGTLTDAVPYSPDRIAGLPLRLLPRRFTMPLMVHGDDDWIASGVTVEAGDVYRLTAAGRVNLIGDCAEICAEPLDCESLCPMMVFNPEGGLVLGSAIGTTPPPFPDRTGTMTAGDAMVGALIARVGEDGDPFQVGRGLRYTAEESGELFFRVNDNYYADNTGVFMVRIAAARIANLRDN
jgi:hypothetical protein